MPQPTYMHTMYNFIFAGYCAATAIYLLLLFKQSMALARTGKRILFLTLFLQTIYIVLRVRADHAYTNLWYAPVANIFEEATSLTWGLTLLYLITETMTGFRALGTFVTPAITLLVGWCALGGGAMDQSIEQPPPALQSYWIDIHVPTHIIAYSAFTLAFGMAVAYFLKNKEEKRLGVSQRADSPVLSEEDDAPPRGSVAVAERTSLRHEKPAATVAIQSTGFLSWIPSTESLDKMMYWTVVVGFGFMTALLMLGATWAEVSWGTYWGWDPKETSALITWLVYAIYVHGRLLLGWGTKRRDLCAKLCIVGFAAVLFTYLGVGFLLPGLHSYLKG